MRDTFIFYRSIYESAQALNEKERLAFYEAVMTFSLDFTEPTLEALPEAFFKLVRPTLDKSNKGYMAGKLTKHPGRVVPKHPADNKDKDKDKDNKKKDVLLIPDWIDTKIWLEWSEYRKEKKNKLTNSTITKQIKFLEKHKEDHIKIIEQSIQNGWTGLFEIKDNKKEEKTEWTTY